ncbi:MAG: alpha/beta hydrolase [Flavobacteriaceae bacterium]|nr:alpha/beta hydrolase [Flavobacteriaceae bacterium]
MKYFISYKNAQIAYTSTGKGTAVVLLHGFLENSMMWNKIAKELSKRNRVICIDLLGHGKTDCIGYIHSMELMADVVNTVIKHLKIRRIILVGHSMGGYVALAFAEKYHQKVKGLCLMNSTSYADTKERNKLRLKANKMIQTNFNSIVKISFTNLFSKQSKKQFKQEISEALQEALQTTLQGYMACQEGMRVRPQRFELLKKSAFKKFFVIGKKDPILNYQELLQEAKNTDSTYVLLEEGHMSHIENKNQLTIALLGFVKGC